MTEYIMVRPKAVDGKATIQVWKKSSNPDLSEYRLVQVRDNGMEEYVHQDEYEVYKKIYEKKE